MRGRPVTERDVASILRMISYVASDGTWLLSYEAVAQQLDIDARTVSEHVRRAAASWGKHTQWKPVDCQDSY